MKNAIGHEPLDGGCFDRSYGNARLGGRRTPRHVRSQNAGAPIHPKAIITILDPADIDTWLRGSYDDIVCLHKLYDPAR
ncbi:hypothetical protein [Sphingomonas sp. PP-CE-1G-424]|uniref:hypothetical protein n=1 Tax=Sphingomonas sp. PP-CE-1G-424 TaxID=2135658 RepID=UPI003261BB2F